MEGYGPLSIRQYRAILKEYLEALEDRDHDLALKIDNANSDIFGKFRSIEEVEEEYRRVSSLG